MEHEEKGILVDRLVHAESPRQQKQFHEILFLALRFVFLLAASFGIAGAFIRTFAIPVNTLWFVVGLILVCALFTAVYSWPKKIYLTLPGTLAVMGILGFLFRDLLTEGICCIYNLIMCQVNTYYDVKIPLASVGTLSGSSQTVSVLFILTLFIGILASGMVYFLDARVTALIMTFPLALALAVGLFPDMLSTALMLFGLVGIYFLQHTRQRESFRTQMISVQIGTTTLARLCWQTAAVAAALSLVLIPVSYFQLGKAINQGYESQSELREDIRNGDLIGDAREFWKKLMRGEWDWLPFDIVRSSGVHGGKLSNVKEIRDYGDLHLYLDISDDLTAPLYIRGYVGSNYTGKGWKEQTDEQKEAAAAAGMSIGQLGKNYYSLLEELQQEGNAGVYGRLRFVITNRDANPDYSYIPYGSDISEFLPSDAYDIHTEEKTDETTMNLYYMNTQKLSNLEALEEAGKTRTEDMSYREYVRQTYLDLPVEGLEQFWAEYGQMSFDSVTDCVAFVRENLNSHAEYTKIPGATPGGEDYVEYFLYENRKGACTHFASAAVLMFRSFGIPARYVEGYMTTELLSGSGANEIYDRSAHAWPEIYIDGVGWVPIEVTPGFLNEEDMQDDREEDPLNREDLNDVENTTEEETTEEETTEPEENTVHLETESEEESTSAAHGTKPSSANPTEPSTTAPDETEDSKSSQMIWTILKIALIIAAVVVLIALILFLINFQYRKRLEKLDARLNDSAPRDGILAAFTMVEKLSSEEGLLLDEYAD